MAEEAEAAPVEGQDQPSTDSAPETGTSAEVQESEKFSGALDEQPDEITQDWLQDRYKQMQADYTTKTQGLAEQRKETETATQWIEALSDPDTQEEAFQSLAQQLGYELADEGDDGLEEEGEDQFRDPRVDELLAQQEQAAQAQAHEELVQHVEKLTEGLDLTARQKQAIVRESIDAGFNQEATEQVVKGWRDDFEQHKESVISAYRKSKKAPSPPASGSTGTPDVPITDSRARLKRAQEVAEQQYAG